VLIHPDSLHDQARVIGAGLIHTGIIDLVKDAMPDRNQTWLVGLSKAPTSVFALKIQQGKLRC
jgi:hypothetical protein